MKKILIVEDDMPSMMFLKYAVKKILACDHEVKTAINGFEAIDLLENDSFDYALLDFRLPIISGLEICDRIREKDHGTDHYTKVALTTAQVELKEMNKYCIDTFLFKPINKLELHNFFMEETCPCEQAKKNLD